MRLSASGDRQRKAGVALRLSCDRQRVYSFGRRLQRKLRRFGRHLEIHSLYRFGGGNAAAGPCSVGLRHQ